MPGTLHVLRPAPAGPSDTAARRLLEAWLEDVKYRADLAEGTKDNYRRVVKALVAWAGDTPFLQLDLHGYVHHRRALGIAPRTLDLELTVLRMVFLWSKEERSLPIDAHLRFPRLRVDRRKFVINHRTPTPDEVSRVLEAMPDDDWRLALSLLAKTGARVGEVTALRGQDYDGSRQLLALGASEGNTKTGLRWFPLDDESAAALAGRSGRAAGPLFDFEGLTDPKQALRKRLARACFTARVPEFTPHGLRRMVVGRLMRAGVDPGTAASLTGHSVTVMLRLYQEVTDEDRRRGAERAALGVLSGR
ncbi:MAG: tyrosine-type recombinase/integrase [Deltaproteobacteria bacterium]|nr:tyrosine-type recombinase/integrase [Deltaproteobacteria bacterium]